MLGKKIINTGGVACTTDTTQILDAQLTQSTALYRFEDNANDTASGTGKFNKGAVFNGSNSQILLPNSFDSALGNNNFSYSFWINGPMTSTNKIWYSFAQNYFIYFGYFSSQIYISLYNDTFSTGVTLSANTWTHIAFVKSSTAGIKIYKDGVSAYTSTTSAATNNLGTSGNGQVNVIGRYSGSGYDFDGKLDQVRFFNKAISASEVTTLYNETTSTTNTLQILGDTSCVAAYTFEGNANDLSTNYNGTATNVIYDYSGTNSSATYVAGKFDKAALFNTNSSIDISGDFISRSSNSSMTWSSWINFTNVHSSSFRSLVGSNAGGGFAPGAFAINLYGSSSGISCSLERYYNNSQNYSTSYATVGLFSYSPNTWYHLALSYNSSSSEATVYINGSKIGSSYSLNYTNSSYTSYSALAIGRYSTTDAGYGFDGMMDQIRIFDKALSPGEVNSLYNETTTTAALGTISNPSTVAYYKMQDATDETGSYNGTASNVDFNVQGKYGFAGKFNGSNSVISASNPNSLGGARSFSAWIKTTSTAFQGIITNGGGSHASGLNMFVYNNKLYSTSGKGNGENYGPSSSANINTGDWVHCVLTMSGTAIGSTLKTYVNGSLDGTHTTTVLITDTYAAFRIGGRYINSSNAAYFNGSIDQVRIFNKAISADEVTKLYNEIQCANTITTPESYFNSVLYTGNGSTTQTITGVGFEAGFTWIKDRSVAESHALFDSVRGANQWLHSNTTAAQTTYSGNYGLLSWNSNGFQVGNGTAVNDSSENYVSWNWKAPASNTTNNDGTIASTVRASQESGFSIVKYTGNATSGATFGHGLNSKPDLILIKNLVHGGNYHWTVYSGPNGATGLLYLNLTDGFTSTSSRFNNTEPTSSVVTLGNDGTVNDNGDDHIAYCFANVDGYQRIGSFVGNGSNNGPFIYTGFEPAWIIIKNTDTAYRWYMLDNKRCTTNPNNARLFANDTTAEATNSNIINFHTNGFEIITSDAEVNKSGDKILFMAIAANPDTTAPTEANSFKTVLYTGNGSATARNITTGFKPDFTWIKGRETAGTWNVWYDTLRGPTNMISSNQANAAQTYGSVTPFGTGFTLASTGGDINSSGEDYVSWNWKALDHDRNLATINTDGTIPSIVSSNPKAGFSIVQYNPIINYFDQYGVGHGLNAAPQLIIQKRTSGSTSDWYVITTVIDGSVDYLRLNTTVTKTDMSGNYANFTLGSNSFSDWWNAGDTIINYCWHSVAGYSKIGVYQGNSSTTGPLVSVGFEPSFIMVKGITSSYASHWAIIDSVRDTDTVKDKRVLANLTNAESDDANWAVEFNSDGFQPKSTFSGFNHSSGTYLYMAFK